MRIFCRQQRFVLLFATLLLALVASQTQASPVQALAPNAQADFNSQRTDFNSQRTDFNSQRTDFRDESIYFVITTRFYDGDPSNNVLCWDNQQAQISTEDPCWRGDFQGG